MALDADTGSLTYSGDYHFSPGDVLHLSTDGICGRVLTITSLLSDGRCVGDDAAYLIDGVEVLVVSSTPEILQKIGFNALPVTINQTHVNYILNGIKDADHFLGEAFLKQLPQSLENPVAVIASQSKANRAMVILKHTVNGKQTVVPIEIDGFAHLNNIRIDSNAIASVYGKNSALNQLFSAISDESSGKTSLYYWNKKEAMALLQSAGHQLSGGLPKDGFVHSIRESSSPVKSKFENVTETQQFKRWFGDWQNHPESASKVVNADGTPMVVYRILDI